VLAHLPWVDINNEDFFNSKPLSPLRLRGGWGREQVNELIEPEWNCSLFIANEILGSLIGGAYGSTGYSILVQDLLIQNLTWETTVTNNIGFGLVFK